jgi:hypothetical protein
MLIGFPEAAAKSGLAFKAISNDETFRPFLDRLNRFHFKPNLGHIYRFECEKLQI